MTYSEPCKRFNNVYFNAVFIGETKKGAALPEYCALITLN